MSQPYPHGLTDEEIVGAIKNATTLLARHFKFGHYDIEDIQQEGALEALKAIRDGKYKPGETRPDGTRERPLANFVYVHIRNRLLNLRRNKLRRNDPPCWNCHNSIPGHTQHENGQYCNSYLSWLKTNLNKANIMCPIDLGAVSEDQHQDTSDATGGVELDELKRRIDRELPVALRATYLRMLAGERVSRAERAEVENAVRQIIREDEV